MRVKELFAKADYQKIARDPAYRSYQLHGHMHNKPDYNEQNRADGIRRYDVGVDANGYAPVSIEEILRFFENVSEQNN